MLNRLKLAIVSLVFGPRGVEPVAAIMNETRQAEEDFEDPTQIEEEAKMNFSEAAAMLAQAQDSIRIAKITGIVVETDNEDPENAANKTYLAARLRVLTKDEETEAQDLYYLFTETEIKRAMNRATKNPEDIPWAMRDESYEESPTTEVEQHVKRFESEEDVQDEDA